SLFAMQFIWQFPHFWAIAWLLNDDYRKAGYKLLPAGENRSKKNAFQMFFYSLFIIPAGMLPWALGITGLISVYAAILLGIIMIIPAFMLYLNSKNINAKRLMFASFIYLPIMQIIYVIDKI
ncbi:MAG: UbiA family prenyltransferase, partial [Flavobacteriales bacterium]